MKTGTVWVIQNTHDEKFIGKDKVALWCQEEDLSQAHFFPAEHNAKVNAKRLNGYVKKRQEEVVADKAKGYVPDRSHLKDNFIVRPVDIKLT